MKDHVMSHNHVITDDNLFDGHHVDGSIVLDACSILDGNRPEICANDCAGLNKTPTSYQDRSDITPPDG